MASLNLSNRGSGILLPLHLLKLEGCLISQMTETDSPINKEAVHLLNLLFLQTKLQGRFQKHLMRHVMLDQGTRA